MHKSSERDVGVALVKMVKFARYRWVLIHNFESSHNIIEANSCRRNNSLWHQDRLRYWIESSVRNKCTQRWGERRRYYIDENGEIFMIWIDESSQLLGLKLLISGERRLSDFNEWMSSPARITCFNLGSEPLSSPEWFHSPTQNNFSGRTRATPELTRGTGMTRHDKRSFKQSLRFVRVVVSYMVCQIAPSMNLRRRQELSMSSTAKLCKCLHLLRHNPGTPSRSGLSSISWAREIQYIPPDRPLAGRRGLDLPLADPLNWFSAETFWFTTWNIRDF
jgi:hypothetical protein